MMGDTIADAIAARIAADGSWTVRVTNHVEDEINVEKLALVDAQPPDMTPESNLYYRADQRFDVLVQLRLEDAVVDSDDNAQRMLRQAAAEIVRAVIGAPTELGIAGILRLDPQGFEPKDSGEFVNLPRGVQSFDLTYRVNWNDPSVYSPGTVG